MGGKTAEAVVRRMQGGTAQEPTAVEGFHKVVVVQTDSQHAAVANTLAALPPSDKLLQHATPSSAAPAGEEEPPRNATAPLDSGRDPGGVQTTVRRDSLVPSTVEKACPVDPNEIQTPDGAKRLLRQG